MGGGAVCFSFGTYWNIGCYTVDLPEKCFESETKFKYRETCLPVAQGSKTPSVVRSSPRAAIPVSRMKIRSSNEFNKILASNKPIILEGMDLGCCLEKWTTAYLKQQIGPLKQVSNSFGYDKSINVLTSVDYCSRSFISSHEFQVQKLQIYKNSIWRVYRSS